MTTTDVPPGPRWRVAPTTIVRTAPRSAIIAVVAVVALAAGFVTGRLTERDPDMGVAETVERRVLPLITDADAIWTSGSDFRASVADGLVALRHQDDGGIVTRNRDQWLVAYDAILLQLAGIDLPAVARPVQRQFISAVMLSRDAAEVLGRAADVTGAGRTDLLVEVDRLRRRGEQLTQSARASVADLAGQRADVAPPAPLPRF